VAEGFDLVGPVLRVALRLLPRPRPDAGGGAPRGLAPGHAPAPAYGVGPDLRLSGLPCALQRAVRVVLVPVEPRLARAWCLGEAEDRDLIQGFRKRLPCPVAVMIGYVDGGPAGMRGLVHVVRQLAEQVRICAFVARTSAYGASRAFERLGGVSTWSGPDGRQRWWIPAEPFFAWLRTNAGKSRARPATRT
jgi:hypothetical protein